MKHLIMFALLISACGDIESKRKDLTQDQKQCVAQCYDLEQCNGDRPDPCADFCLSEDGPQLMETALSECLAGESN